MKKRADAFLFAGGAISFIMVCVIVMGWFWTPYDPTAMDAGAKFSHPSLQHLLGTDNFGRDIFSRVVDGAGTSFVIALCVVAMVI